jgi:hypothetical protein
VRIDLRPSAHEPGIDAHIEVAFADRTSLQVVHLLHDEGWRVRAVEPR